MSRLGQSHLNNTVSNFFMVGCALTHIMALCPKYPNIPHLQLQLQSRTCNIAQKNTTADILIEDQLCPPLHTLPDGTKHPIVFAS